LLSGKSLAVKSKKKKKCRILKSLRRQELEENQEGEIAAGQWQ
jgi:hypothetical protein